MKSGLELTIEPAFNFLLYLLQLSINFLIAVILENFCKHIKEIQNSIATPDLVHQFLPELQAAMQRLKNNLSPLLFMIFSFKCLIIIHAALNIGFALEMPNAENQSLYVFLLIYACWELFYTALIVEETLAEYKTLASYIRLVLYDYVSSAGSTKIQARGIYCAKYYGQGGGEMVPGKKMKNKAVRNEMKKEGKGKRRTGKGGE